MSKAKMTGYCKPFKPNNRRDARFRQKEETMSKKDWQLLKAYQATGLTPEEVERIKRERDAAIADIERECKTCFLCSVNNGTGEMCPYYDDCNQVDGDHWEWRGVKEDK